MRRREKEITDIKSIEKIIFKAKVCFEFDTDSEITESKYPCKWGMKYRSVIGLGKAIDYIKGRASLCSGLNCHTKNRRTYAPTGKELHHHCSNAQHATCCPCN